MKVRLIALSITLIASASASSNPALAGSQERGMRFEYAPNVYKLEDPRTPQNEYSASPRPAHSAMEGKVPHGPSFLGVDPQFLTKPAPPPMTVTNTQVAMRPSVVPTSINSPFRQEFGGPNMPPQAAQSKMLPTFGSPSADKAVSGKLAPHHSQQSLASKNVNGKLLTRKHAVGQSAKQALALNKPVETYGKNFGYVPGQVFPVSSGARMSSTANVYGQILTRQTH